MPTTSRQLRIVLLILAAVIGVLTIAYFVLFSQTMVPVYQNIRESDASAIVAELDKAGISYRLENDGRDILVAEDQAAQARVVVAGSSVSLGGTVGFELFNDSDMGLTEFAQKINFQRAMQGELARTIMMMDEVSFARVHLALPERSIFRGAQGQPTAAVTIEMAPGTYLTSRKVDGVRQLVASSVPGLSAFAVTVLDEKGDLVSGSPPSGPGRGVDSEAGALEAFYAARGRSAVRAVLPNFPFELSVIANTPIAGAQLGPPLPLVQGATDSRSQPARTDSSLRVLLRTLAPLSDGDREAIKNALVAALQLDRGKGDVLHFTTGAVGAIATGPSPTPPMPAASPPLPESSAKSWKWSDGMGDALFSRWTAAALLLVVVLALLLRPRRQLDQDEAASFAELLRTAAAERKERGNG
jgi:flagellar M-ring protein FliF